MSLKKKFLELLESKADYLSISKYKEKLIFHPAKKHLLQNHNQSLNLIKTFPGELDVIHTISKIISNC